MIFNILLFLIILFIIYYFYFENQQKQNKEGFQSQSMTIPGNIYNAGLSGIIGRPCAAGYGKVIQNAKCQQLCRGCKVGVCEKGKCRSPFDNEISVVFPQAQTIVSANMF